MYIPIHLSWWLSTAAYLYLAVAVYLALRRTRHWILKVFFVALCFALFGKVASELIILARVHSVLKEADISLLFGCVGDLAWLAYPTAVIAAVGAIVWLKKLPPTTPAAQQQLHAATPLHRRDKTTNRLIIAVACLGPFAIIARFLSVHSNFRWLLYMDSDLVSLLGGVALLVVSILLTLRDRRWLALGLGGIIFGLMILFPYPP